MRRRSPRLESSGALSPAWGCVCVGFSPPPQQSRRAPPSHAPGWRADGDRSGLFAPASPPSTGKGGAGIAPPRSARAPTRPAQRVSLLEHSPARWSGSPLPARPGWRGERWSRPAALLPRGGRGRRDRPAARPPSLPLRLGGRPFACARPSRAGGEGLEPRRGGARPDAWVPSPAPKGGRGGRSGARAGGFAMRTGGLAGWRRAQAGGGGDGTPGFQPQLGGGSSWEPTENGLTLTDPGQRRQLRGSPRSNPARPAPAPEKRPRSRGLRARAAPPGWPGTRGRTGPGGSDSPGRLSLAARQAGGLWFDLRGGGREPGVAFRTEKATPAHETATKRAPDRIIPSAAVYTAGQL